MIVRRKALIVGAVIVVALFIIAAPLGDRHHGLGRHNRTLADLGAVFFGGFLIGAAVLILLIVVALIQASRRSRRTSS